MNSIDAARFCDSWLVAWTGNQPDRLIQFYSDDTFYQDPARPDGLRGRLALQAYFTKLLAKNPHWEWKREEIISTEKGFVLKWSALIPVGQGSVAVSGLDIVEVEHGKITRNEVYFDTSVLRLGSP